MNVIVIYHHPQECGNPYLAFISQESGEVVETVDLPEGGYYNSGCESIITLQKVYSFTEEVCQSTRPTVDNVRVKAYYGSPGKRYVYQVTKVEVTGYDPEILPTWNAKIYVDACIEKRQYRYAGGLDVFRQQLTEAGFDMSGWCLYKRMKTPFKEFLTSICSSYKDYHLVNLLEIG